MKENKKVRINGRLRAYFRWPLYMSIFMLVGNLAMYQYDLKAGFIFTGLFAVYLFIVLLIFFTSSNEINNGLIDFATHYGQVQHQLLKQFSLPYVLLDDGARIIWCNEAFAEAFGPESQFKKSISLLIPEIKKDSLPMNYDPVELIFKHKDRIKRADLQRIDLSEMAEQNNLPGFDATLVAVFVYDETELDTYRRKVDEEALIAGLVYVDNYDEVLESIDDARKTILSGYVERQVNAYFENYDAIVRKTDTDKYFVAIKRKGFDEMLESKIEILEQIKMLKIGNERAFTLSMGFGGEGESFADSVANSKNAMELALGRGGDQAVIKLGDRVTYFGGKSEQQEKTTKVRARVKSHALREIILASDRVLVMGHKNPDIDSFGACVGVRKMCSILGKECSIVLGEMTAAISPLASDFLKNPENGDGITISPDLAGGYVTGRTALVVVDTNRPFLTECPQLLNLCKNIVVLDHHRQMSDRIEGAALSYIEPYVSSTCEMITEILQYADEKVKLKPAEADCLYAGIMIDTNNFLSKTGVRTFEAAAFLRRHGADITKVRKVFRENVENCKAKAQAIENVEIFKSSFAIAICPFEGLSAPNIIAAQAANELLNINSVKASFVVTQDQEQTLISARSIDEVNVQLIMEKIGGGGHLNMAGAQFTDKSPQDCVILLKETIVNMMEQEEI